MRNQFFATFSDLLAAALVALVLVPGIARAQDEAAAEEPAAEESAEQGDAQAELEALVKRGQEEYEAEDYEAAAATFSEVAAKSGGYNPLPLLLRAKAYAKMEEYEAALKDLKDATTYGAQNPGVAAEAASTRADIFMEVGAFDQALPDVQAAVSFDRNNPGLQFKLGKVLANVGRTQPGAFDAAVKALTKYLKSEEAEKEENAQQKAEALRLRAGANAALTYYDEANEDLDASLEIDGENYESYFTRGTIELLQKNYAAAVEAFEVSVKNYVPKKEIDKMPFIQGYLTLASALEEQGKEETDPDKKKAIFERERDVMAEMVEKIPEDDQNGLPAKGAALFRQAVADRLLGNMADAVKGFSQAIELNPGFSEAYFRRGICFFNMGEEGMAIGDFEQAAALNFASPRENLWKGLAHAQQGDYIEAIRAYGEALAVSDRYTPAYVNRGLAYMQLKDYDKAISDFNDAIRIQPTEPKHYYRRGQAYAAKGDTEKAIRSLMNAVEFDNTFMEAHVALADLLERTGRKSLADEYRRRGESLRQGTK